jgi:hypothetical protein
MKKFTLIIALIGFVVFTSNAQTLEKVHSIVKQLKSFEWYAGQAELWQLEIHKDSTNADAWYNYYIANRMANLTGKPEKWKYQKRGILTDLEQIVKEMEKNIPNTFEYNHVVWWNGGNDQALASYLFKAVELAPERPEVFDDLVTYYVLQNQREKVELYCKKWFESGDVSPGVLNMNYNMLMSVEKDAIIFVNGDNDTFPKWILQYVQNIRPDVGVFNLSLLYVEEYANKLLSEYNIPQFKKSVKDFYTDEVKESGNYQIMYNSYQLALIEHIIHNCGERPAYFGSTLSNSIYSKFEDSLYVEGLAFRYSDCRYDNLAYLKKNIEQRFHLDYLSSEYIFDISKSVVDHYHMNYILPFSTLYEHYTLAGDSTKATWVKGMMLDIAKKVGKLEEIESQLEAISTE